MSSSTSPIFTGSSSYSKDFAQVITRAQQIASLPITLLTNQKTTLTGEQTALAGLSTAFSSLQASTIALGSAVNGSNRVASYSDSTVAAATVGPAALPGVYNLEVVDPGSLATATSNGAGVTDPAKGGISGVFAFTLHANGVIYTDIMPSDSTLNALADAINSSTKGDVRATIVNFGTTAAPSYQLSLQNTKYGALDITLDDGQGGPNLLGAANGGVAVQYRVNGQPVAPATLSSDSRNLTLSPDLTATVLARGTTSITVTQSTSGMVSAINSFVKAYNSARTTLDAQRGTGGGALAGQSIVSTLSDSLRNLASYGSSGAISSISAIGLTFDQNGVLSFDSTVLAAAAAKDFKSVTDFWGNTTDSGFLKAANDTLSAITDSAKGVIPTTLLSVAGEITDTGNRISENQARVDQLTESLNHQMAAADALIASLQQQATYFTNMFAAMSANQNSMR